MAQVITDARAIVRVVAIVTDRVRDCPVKVLLSKPLAFIDLIISRAKHHRAELLQLTVWPVKVRLSG